MRRWTPPIFWIALVLSALTLPAFATQDQPGAEDPLPLIRDHGQTLAMQVRDVAPRDFPIPVGPLGPLAQVDDWLRVHGLVSRTLYTRRGPARRVETMYQREREVLERQGFEIRAAGFTQDRAGGGVGSRRWILAYLETYPVPDGMAVAPGDDAQAQGVVIGARDDAIGTLWAVVVLTQPEGGQIAMLVDTVQTERAAPPPPIGALTLVQSMDTYGHAVLDGLAFNDDGSLGEGSETVLATVGHFLGQNLRQSFRIVGHSDDTGDLAEAARRSQAQAEAVVTALVERHGANRERLRAFGIGPLAPLFPNDTAQGRARNRRVELVAGP
ncbi:OmpA family protein [Rhodobacter sp. NTK016B]|uniref:OmpA family protein n=1 Tax=Rhodobacter sp. NTK016B TaxID=2759676 RepID=UPI001A8CEBB1|nr:OmpA family protein [Rhodobacter sp. NTK016B]MBN8292583.1 OmpA family protein [Rhodobacter sp. NTK016B]